MPRARRNRGRAPQRDARFGDAEMEEESLDGAPRRYRPLQDVDADLDQNQELRRQVQTWAQQMATMQTQKGQIAATIQRRDLPEDQVREDALDNSDGSASSYLSRPEINPFHARRRHEHNHVVVQREENRRRCFRVNLPEFSGGLSAEDFVDWLDEVEHIFEYVEVPQEERVPAAAMRLKGRASV